MDIETELNKELQRLQTKYSNCQEYVCEWQPSIRQEQLPFDKQAELNGEVNKVEHKLMIYCSEYEEAMHTLRHEFFEAMLDQVVNPYVILYNNLQRGFEKAFMENNYIQKESLIERFVKVEEDRGDKR
ncbi:MAG: hypothetical protein WC365_06315 [Candidatus Babeliales bacterium]